MSDTLTKVENYVSTAYTAITHGANSIYHDVVAIETNVAVWKNNPAIMALVDTGLQFASGFLTRTGVPLGTVEIIAEDVFTAVKALAALDSTVQSGGGSMTKTSTTTTTMEPAASTP